MIVQETLQKCGSIANNPFDDSLLFGVGLVTDPETGNEIKIYGYSVKDNEAVIGYIESLYPSLNNLYACLEDLLFFERILSVENSPVFQNKTDDTRYLKINYQHWIIKTVTVYDCIMSVLNSVFELGLTNRTILTAKENLHIVTNEKLTLCLKNLEKLLNQNLTGIKSTTNQTKLKNIRNRIVHNNEFEHPEIESLNLHAFFMQLEVLNLNNGDFQVAFSKLSNEILDRIKVVNGEIIKEVYNILQITNAEYKNRFQQKLVDKKEN